MDTTGHESYRARNVAARATRDPKRHTPVGELLPRWKAEIETVGWSVERVAAAIEHEAAAYRRPNPHLSSYELRAIAQEALADDGPLVARKIFSKRDVIVAVVPHLYGRDVTELAPVVKRTLSDPEAVRLLGVAGAHQPAYAIAREEAIARSVESQASRRNAACVTPAAAQDAIDRAEVRLARPLTDGQRQAVAAMLTSGRGVELVVGVAGSGKTTALAATRDGFEAAGFVVLGTSTSGQAARTLDREAGIDSRTLASLNYRIQHNTLLLLPCHVAVLDEAAMTDDAALVAFLEAARETGAKVVAVGDPRQLSSVGPGGGFEALVSRFGGAVHVLDENVRQADPVERATLAMLRSGDVEAAVAWYDRSGRISVSPDRDTALDAVVAGWAADVRQGAAPAMYAWRRANVAELNRRGRATWDELGKLSGPELMVGTTAYRTGDRIVTLAPGARGEIVTSECGTVLAVDVRNGDLAATMDDGRIQRFGPEELGADHLAHGYAVTVHRSQGATVARAHALEDGGGRELAYVKMSRARECSTVYVVADSLEQATEDLSRSWAQSRRIGWAIDRGTPAPGLELARSLSRSPVVSASLRHGCLVAERAAVAAVVPVDPGYAYGRAEDRVRRLSAQLNDLNRAEGWGTWKGTPVGQAAIDWQAAVRERDGSLGQADHAGWREAHGLRKLSRAAAERVGPLKERFDALAAPERARLEAELPEAKKLLAELEGRYYGNLHFQIKHPEALRRLDHLDNQIATVGYELDLQRQGLDGIPAKPAPLHKPHPGMGLEAPGLERTIERDFGLGL
jgi:hypothetical protein